MEKRTGRLYPERTESDPVDWNWLIGEGMVGRMEDGIASARPE